MQIFYDDDGMIDDRLLDMPLADVLKMIAVYMQTIDSYKAKIDIDSDTYFFTITAQSKDTLKKE